MINLAIALAAGILSWILTVLVLDSVWAGILPFLAVTIGLYIWLARKANKVLEVIVLEAQKQMAQAQTARTQKQRDDAIDRSIETLKKGFALKNRQFLVASQLNAQIGQLLYVQKRFEKARPFLEKAYIRAWMAIAMLGCLHFKKKRYDEMKEAFEKATKYNKKEAMLWSLYAWCLWKANETEAAISVLNRGAVILPSDERIESNLTALKNNKKMKMRGWKEMWYQFHLEAPPQPKMKVDKRGLYRGR